MIVNKFFVLNAPKCSMKFIIMLTALILGADAARAQWAPEVRLTNDPAESSPACSSQRSMAAAGNLVLVAWQDYRDGFPEIYSKRSTDGGITWGIDTRLTNHHAAEAPSIAVSGNFAHIVWEDRRDENGEIYYKRSVDGGANWEAEQRLTADTADSYLPCIDASGAMLHVVWSDDRSGNSEIHYKRSVDGGSTWESDLRLTENPAASYFPAIAVSGSIVHAAWSDYRDGGNEEIYYKRSSDGGASWSPDIRLTNAKGWSEWPGIAVSGSNVHLVWYDFREGGVATGQIYYKRSTDAGLTWESDVRITADLFGAYLASVAAAGPVVHLVWSEYGDIYSRRSSDEGASWAPATHLTNNQSLVCPPVTSNPCVALSGPAVHVVWMDRRDGNGEIYYRQNPTGETIIDRRESPDASPEESALERNYPNPFKETTNIGYRIGKACFVEISLRDVSGRRVSTLVRGVKSPGRHTTVFNGAHLVPGIYILSMRAGASVEHSIVNISR